MDPDRILPVTDHPHPLAAKRLTSNERADRGMVGRPRADSGYQMSAFPARRC